MILSKYTNKSQIMVREIVFGILCAKGRLFIRSSVNQLLLQSNYLLLVRS